MKNTFLLIYILLLLGCQNISKPGNTTVVNNAKELNKAIKNAEAGEVIVLKNGVWKDVAIHFVAKGTKDSPITLRAETPGKVLMEVLIDKYIYGK